MTLTDAEKAQVEDLESRVLANIDRELADSLNSGSTYFSNGPSTSFPPVTLESITELTAMIPKLRREVFRFEGTYAEFVVAMRAAGFVVCSSGISLPEPQNCYGLMHPLHAMIVEEDEDGQSVWIAGNYRDIEDAKNGKTPFTWIGGEKPPPRYFLTRPWESLGLGGVP